MDFTLILSRAKPVQQGLEELQQECGIKPVPGILFHTFLRPDTDMIIWRPNVINL